MNEYVIGIDIGATKSHLAIFDTAGSYVDFGRWGPLNHELFPGSYVQFEDELGQFINGLLSKNNIPINQIANAALGVAGVDTKNQHSIISGILQKLGLKRFTLANDAFLGVPAGSPTGIGLCALNGTGCTLAGINKEGKMLQIGGVGYVSADYGGGGMMGKKVVSTVYSELFRKGKPTSMTPILLKKLGVENKFDFVDKIYEKIDNGELVVAACNRMLFEAAHENDEVASDILRDIATSYANGISCLIGELAFPRDEELYIVFIGSVFVKSEHPLLVDSVMEKINQDNPGYRIIYTRLSVPPVAGAVIWALNMLNGKSIYYDTVCAQLKQV